MAAPRKAGSRPEPRGEVSGWPLGAASGWPRDASGCGLGVSPGCRGGRGRPRKRDKAGSFVAAPREVGLRARG